MKLYLVTQPCKHGVKLWGLFKETPDREKQQLPLNYGVIELYTDLI